MLELVELINQIKDAASRQDISSELEALMEIRWKTAFKELKLEAREALSMIGYLILLSTTQGGNGLLQQRIRDEIAKTCDFLAASLISEEMDLADGCCRPQAGFSVDALRAQDAAGLWKAGFNVTASEALSLQLTPWDYETLLTYAGMGIQVYEVGLKFCSMTAFNSLEVTPWRVCSEYTLLGAFLPASRPRELRMLLASPLPSTTLRQKLTEIFPNCRVLISLIVFPRVLPGAIDEELQEVFLEEALSQVTRLEEILLLGEEGGLTGELIQEAFRQAHSLKGGAASMGHVSITEMAHAMEDVLALVREGKICLTCELASGMLRLVDLIRTVLNRPDDRYTQWPGTLDLISSVYDIVEELSEGQFQVEIDLNNEDMVVARSVQVEYELRRHANVIYRWPGEAESELLEVEKKLVITLAGSESRIVAVLENTGLPFSIRRLSSSETPHGVPDAVSPPESSKPVENGKGQQIPGGEQREASTSHFGALAGGDSQIVQTIRVDSKRLDYLVDLVGEILIQRQRVHEVIRRFAERAGMDPTASREVINQLSRLTDDLQHEIFKMRLVPVSTLFVRFHRLVRDLCVTLKKEAELVIEGGNMEVDKHVLEVLSDPLIHLVRNAIDHGLECPKDRLALKKPRKGIIRLACEQEGSYLHILVQDDGRGIDLDRIRAKARALGYDPELMDDEEVMDLIFTPGFSTAEEVTDVSGRGVGLDVVRNNLMNIRGTVTVRTELGQGTTFHLRLPLTTSILDALLVETEGQTYAVPLQDVLEILTYSPSLMQQVMNGEAILLRGETLPLVRLEEVLGEDGLKSQGGGRILVLSNGSRKVGLLVDEVKTHQDIVLKSLSEDLGHIEGIAGATILGNGQVILVLEVSELLSIAARRKMRSS